MICKKIFFLIFKDQLKHIKLSRNTVFCVCFYHTGDSIRMNWNRERFPIFDFCQNQLKFQFFGTNSSKLEASRSSSMSLIEDYMQSNGYSDSYYSISNCENYKKRRSSNAEL